MIHLMSLLSLKNYSEKLFFYVRKPKKTNGTVKAAAIPFLDGTQGKRKWRLLPTLNERVSHENR